MKILFYFIEIKISFVMRKEAFFFINDYIYIRIIEYLSYGRQKEVVVTLFVKVINTMLASLLINIEIYCIILNLEYLKSSYPGIYYYFSVLR